MKHAGVLSALLLTAALLCAMPSLCVWHESPSRAPDSLYPAQLRTLTVWLTPGDVGDRKLLSELCAAFEKQHKGVRIFLRIVSPEEYHAENAVLPDVALFETGTFSAVDRLIPLADLSAASGQYRGAQLAVPLWLSPNVLTFPKSWLGQPFTQEAADSSLLAAGTPAPEQASDGLTHADDLPWSYLLQNGAIAQPEGVGWQQLMNLCPLNERERLRNAVLHTQATASPSVTSSPPLSRPVSHGASPTPFPYAAGAARVETLGAYQAKIKKGEPLAACALSPAPFRRAFHLTLGQSPQQYIISAQMGKAQL